MVVVRKNIKEMVKLRMKFPSGVLKEGASCARAGQSSADAVENFLGGLGGRRLQQRIAALREFVRFTSLESEGATESDHESVGSPDCFWLPVRVGAATHIFAGLSGRRRRIHVEALISAKVFGNGRRVRSDFKRAAYGFSPTPNSVGTSSKSRRKRRYEYSSTLRQSVEVGGSLL